MSSRSFSRRSFLAGSAVGLGFIVAPRRILGGPGERPPSEKLGIAGVGCGGKGTIYNGRVIPETKMAELRDSLPPKTIPRSPGVYKEFIRACKGGEPAGANFENFAGPLTEVVLLGNVALRARQRVEWDPVNLRITNVPKANDYLRRSYRKGWTLG